jgi:hypothetical protein
VFVNRIFKLGMLLMVLLFFLTGCFFDTDLDVLNNSNKRIIASKGLERSFLCFDLDENPYMHGNVVELNGSDYKCVATGYSQWFLKSELIYDI